MVLIIDFVGIWVVDAIKTSPSTLKDLGIELIKKKFSTLVKRKSLDLIAILQKYSNISSGGGSVGRLSLPK